MYLNSLVLWVRYWDAGIATRPYVTLYSITRRLPMSRECHLDIQHGYAAGSVVIVYIYNHLTALLWTASCLYQWHCGGTILLKHTPTAA